MLLFLPFQSGFRHGARGELCNVRLPPADQTLVFPERLAPSHPLSAMSSSPEALGTAPTREAPAGAASTGPHRDKAEGAHRRVSAGVLSFSHPTCSDGEDPNSVTPPRGQRTTSRGTFGEDAACRPVGKAGLAADTLSWPRSHSGKTDDIYESSSSCNLSLMGL